MKKQRRSIRLWQYDYGQPGSYFITFCTNNKECILSSIQDGKIMLLPIGKIVEEEILRTQSIRKNIRIVAFVIMPNHVHLLITVLQSYSLETQSGHFYRQSFSVPSIVAALKAAVTRKCIKEKLIRGTELWQRNYFEHVIRNDEDFERVNHYIELNPVKWEEDSEYPNNS